MPRNLKSKSKGFASEAGAADWSASPVGRRETEREFRQAAKDGTLLVRNGGGPPSAAELKALFEKARASVKKPVSLRIPQGDLDEAKRIAAEKGIGYQTVLKQIISKGLRRAR